LPLPIATNQPVLIHGLFSISPDRARLYQLNDTSTQDQGPAKWNNWLLKGPVPLAWTRLLSNLASDYPNQPAFERWPQSLGDTRDPLSSALEKVLGVIEKESLALWPTDIGYMTTKDALLGTGTESIALRNALREARAPIVYVPEQLQHRSNILFKGRILCPQSLCHFMRTIDGQIKSWSDPTKLEILEYLLSEPEFTNYGGLELFPFKDGIYRSVGESIAFVHRDKLEETLFSLEDFCNLDIEKLSKTAQQALKHGCESSTIHPSIRYRSARCLREYCMSTLFKNVPKDRDEFVLDECAAGIVTEVWTWISKYSNCILDKEFSSLWLLPLSNGHHRKVKPASGSSSVAYYAPVGEIGDLMRKFDARISVKTLPLLDTGPTGLTPRFLSMLMRSESVMSTLCIKDASNMISFIEWLQRTWLLVDHILGEERLLLARLLVSHFPQTLTSLERKAVVGALSSLAIFQKVLWKGESDTMFVIFFRFLIVVTNNR
jgi:sacsin